MFVSLDVFHMRLFVCNTLPFAVYICLNTVCYLPRTNIGVYTYDGRVKIIYRKLCPIHNADADATPLSSRVGGVNRIGN